MHEHQRRSFADALVGDLESARGDDLEGATYTHAADKRGSTGAC
jgi:hypothetical protein